MCSVALLMARLVSIVFFQTCCRYHVYWCHTVKGVVILSCSSKMRLCDPLASDEAIVPAFDGS